MTRGPTGDGGDEAGGGRSFNYKLMTKPNPKILSSEGWGVLRGRPNILAQGSIGALPARRESERDLFFFETYHGVDAGERSDGSREIHHSHGPL